MAYRIRQSCSWCDELNDITVARDLSQAVYCSTCGHRADVARMNCDCQACVNAEMLIAEMQAAEQGEPLDKSPEWIN